MHSQHFHVIALQTHNNTNRLLVQVDQILELVLTDAVHTGGHVSAQLDVIRQHFQLDKLIITLNATKPLANLMRSNIGKNENTIVIHSQNKASVSLVTSVNHTNMIPLPEVLPHFASV